jgi:diguanylate cyclase (GGDEF)-like protein
VSDTTVAYAIIISVLIPTVTVTVAYIRRQHRLLVDAVRDALSDELTGLPNRRAFTTALRTAITNGGRFSVLILDIDRFKTINDRHGHAVGDLVLRTVGHRLAHIDPRIRCAARFGGDEFVLLLDGDDHTARHLADHIWRTFATEPVPWGSGSLPVSVSVGAATYEHGLGAGMIMHRADLALYEAKTVGTVCAYPPGQATAPIIARPADRVRDRHHTEATVPKPRQPAPPPPAGPRAVDADRYRCWFPLTACVPLIEHTRDSRHHQRCDRETRLQHDCPGALELITDGDRVVLGSSGYPPLLNDPANHGTDVFVPAVHTEGLTRTSRQSQQRVEHLHLSDVFAASLIAAGPYGGHLIIEVNGEHVDGYLDYVAAART